MANRRRRRGRVQDLATTSLSGEFRDIISPTDAPVGIGTAKVLARQAGGLDTGVDADIRAPGADLGPIRVPFDVTQRAVEASTPIAAASGRAQSTALTNVREFAASRGLKPSQTGATRRAMGEEAARAHAAEREAERAAQKIAEKAAGPAIAARGAAERQRAGFAHAAAEREAAQEFTREERTGRQEFTSGERQAAQEFAKNERLGSEAEARDRLQSQGLDVNSPEFAQKLELETADDMKQAEAQARIDGRLAEADALREQEFKLERDRIEAGTVERTSVADETGTTITTKRGTPPGKPDAPGPTVSDSQANAAQTALDAGVNPATGEKLTFTQLQRLQGVVKSWKKQNGIP